MSSDIRVLLVAPSLAIVGGQSVQAERLLRGFAVHHDVQMSLCPIDPQLPSIVRRIPYARTVAKMPVYYARLIRGTASCHIVHAFTSSFWGYTLWVIPAIWLSRLFRRKVIVNYRDGRAEEHLREWPSAVSTLRHTDAIVVPSPYLVDVFRRFGLDAEVIPNAIDMSAFPYRERRSVRPRFLTNRGLEPLYNVDCTLRAFRLVQDRYPAAQFIVANDGPLRGKLEALAANLQLQAIEFTGAVSQARMAELYADADIYVMSPLIDNMPGTLLECFAAGVPVVSTDSGGIPQVAQNERNALLVASGSPQQLANGCFRLLEEPGLAARIAKTAYRDCAERYSVGAVINHWNQFYGRLCLSQSSS